MTVLAEAQSRALLKRSGTTWRILEFGTGGFSCKVATEAVRADLDFPCVPGT